MVKFGGTQNWLDVLMQYEILGIKGLDWKLGVMFWFLRVIFELPLARARPQSILWCRGPVDYR
jgi:hypothetical protein